MIGGLSGQRIVVVGGTSGIGAAVVRRLAREGAVVAFTGRDLGRGRELAAETGAAFVAAALTNEASVSAAVDELSAKMGATTRSEGESRPSVDGLVLSTGVLHRGPISETTDAAWEELINTNVIVPFLMACHMMPMLSSSASGTIVTLVSGTASWPEADLGAYSVSKRAALWLVKMLAVEAARHGVRSNAVCPGDTEHGMRSAVSGEEVSNEPPLTPPAGRLATPDDMAGAVSFFLSPDSAFCSGAILDVDGGMRASQRAHRVNQPATRRERSLGQQAPARTSSPRPEDGAIRANLAASTALVTGGTSGIGREIVEQLTSGGVAVAFTGRDSSRGASVAASTGATYIEVDAIQRSQCDRSIDQALTALNGRLDLFVSSTGVVFAEALADTPEAIFREVLEVNLTAPFRYARACLRVMREQQRGAMTFIVSDAAIRGLHHLPAYSIAKAGLLALSEVFAADAASLGVRVNAICPGAVTPGVQTTIAGFPQHAENCSTWGPAPSGRHGSADDIAAAVLFLASRSSEHVSGATLLIDGAASIATRGAARA